MTGTVVLKELFFIFLCFRWLALELLQQSDSGMHRLTLEMRGKSSSVSSPLWVCYACIIMELPHGSSFTNNWSLMVRNKKCASFVLNKEGKKQDIIVRSKKKNVGCFFFSWDGCSLSWGLAWYFFCCCLFNKLGNTLVIADKGVLLSLWRINWHCEIKCG